MAWWAKGIVRGQLGVDVRKQRARLKGEEYGMGRGGATHFMTYTPRGGRRINAGKCGVTAVNAKAQSPAFGSRSHIIALSISASS